MKKIVLMILVAMLYSSSLLGQTTSIKGLVRDAVSNDPLVAANVTLLQQNISTLTNSNGEFTLSYLEAGDDEIRISASGYFMQIRLVKIVGNEEIDLGEFKLRPDLQSEAKQDIILQLSEAQLDDEGITQTASGALSSANDVYIKQTSYNFSPMRFRTRGYDNKYESTYINGVRFVDAERGGFNYSSIGGLNNATRNKDLSYGLSPNAFGYGNLGGNTNINTRASAFAIGHNANAAFSNRSYVLRAQYTYGTGILSNGWAFAVSGVVRWANEGIVDGTFYNSGGLFLSAEKIINDNHSVSFVAFGAPTRRAQQSALTQEVVDLVGSIYYNPYWGYQDGKVRNSRIVHSVDPTAIFSHEWKITERQLLRSGVSFHYSMYSNSALNFYNTRDPRPDYYRNMPSYYRALANDELANELTQDWKTNKNLRQIDWDMLYRTNYANKNTGKNTPYILERRHNNLMEIPLNLTYTNQITDRWKITAGFEGRYSKGMHYKTLDDLLGGELWLDTDPFSERDFAPGSDIIENDLNNPNRKVSVGEKFGYDYDINILSANIFTQSEWTFRNLDLFVGLKGTYTQFYRYGHMKNGRSPENSYGKGLTSRFVDPSAKAGFMYKIDGRNQISANILAETRAPLTRDAYISDRIKDDLMPNLTQEKILSYDLNYSISYPFIRGRVSAFRTHINDGMRKTSYYDSEHNSFLHHTLYGVDKIFQGVELGVSVPIAAGFTFALAGTLADYHYTEDAMGILSWESGIEPDTEPERVAIKGLKVNSGPQLAANATLSYFHRSMLFVDLSLNYFDNNYLDFATNNRRESNMDLYTTEKLYNAFGAQEKLKGGFMLDASIGKLIYLKNRKSLNFNLSLSNILNNTNLITGGYQQARIPTTDQIKNEKSTELFRNKYYYAWGFNFFLNAGFKF